jgi:hypothetical protein
MPFDAVVSSDHPVQLGAACWQPSARHFFAGLEQPLDSVHYFEFSKILRIAAV